MLKSARGDADNTSNDPEDFGSVVAGGALASGELAGGAPGDATGEAVLVEAVALGSGIDDAPSAADATGPGVMDGAGEHATMSAASTMPPALPVSPREPRANPPVSPSFTPTTSVPPARETREPSGA
jgi:hypothetical protein